MSLVAYAASSDEDSEDEQEVEYCALTKSTENLQPSPKTDDKFINETKDAIIELRKTTLSLPPPKLKNDQELFNPNANITSGFIKLPTPKYGVDSGKSCEPIEEDDDEFLHKKAVPLLEEKPKPIPVAKRTVKITIPALKEFDDVERDLASNAKSKSENVQALKVSGLLSILPKAKSEQNFSKTTTNHVKEVPAFIPDTIRNRRPAQNTEGIDGQMSSMYRKPPKNINAHQAKLVDCSDSDGDNSDGEVDGDESVGDFFSLNSAEVLPEVSTDEINAMVAKRAAEMAQTKDKYLSTTVNVIEKQTEEDEALQEQAQKRYNAEQDLDAQAMQALVGVSGAKRRRKEQKDIQIMDISSAEVLPNREEWMRTALAGSTAFQATGVLVDEEPASGTRRKHQITYLAHKAKANEAELQAMWSANRHTRRATQSKYGF